MSYGRGWLWQLTPEFLFKNENFLRICAYF